MLLIPTLLCPKPWVTMTGDETRRFCSYCKKHVHNLPALSVSERLALLSSPAASICSRYRIAVRRPVKGKEQSYFHHLAKYGAGVALAGSVLLVLWEMHGRTEKETVYRTAAPNRNVRGGMPGGLFQEHETFLLGMLAVPERDPADEIASPETASPSPTHIDLKLDSAEINRLIDHSIRDASPPSKPATAS